MEPYRIVLADDHAIFRQGLKKIIQGRDGLSIVGEVADGLGLLDLLKKIEPDLVILDISMPRLRGLEAVPEIKSMHPDLKVLMLTMHKREAYLRHAVSVGADGYLLKEDAGTDLFSAIQAIRRGEKYLSPMFPVELNRLLEKSDYGRQEEVHQSILTSREAQVLKLVAESKSNKEIADLLHISVRTVEHHRASAMKKLKIKGTAELMKYAIREGYTYDAHGPILEQPQLKYE